MRTIIAQTAQRLIVPIVVIISVYLLLRGHDAPGGGFIAALVAGAAVVIRRFVGPEGEVRHGEFLGWMSSGLMLAVGGGLIGIALSGAFLGPQIWEAVLPLVGEVKITLSFLFDVGVYLTVIAVIRAVIDEMGAGR